MEKYQLNLEKINVITCFNEYECTPKRTQDNIQGQNSQVRQPEMKAHLKRSGRRNTQCYIPHGLVIRLVIFAELGSKLPAGITS